MESGTPKVVRDEYGALTVESMNRAGMIRLVRLTTAEEDALQDHFRPSAPEPKYEYLTEVHETHDVHYRRTPGRAPGEWEIVSKDGATNDRP